MGATKAVAYILVLGSLINLTFVRLCDKPPLPPTEKKKALPHLKCMQNTDQFLDMM
jgi:hypothetical protein